MDHTEKYPLDYDALQRGHTISATRLEAIFRKPPGDPKYQLDVLKLCRDIERHFRDHRGDYVSVVQGSGFCKRREIRILTEEEQYQYETARARRSVGRYALAHLRVASIPADKLSVETRQKRDRWLHKHGWYLAQLRKEPPPRLDNSQ